MKKSSNKFRSFIIFILLNSVVINAYSISISARRLYLDPKSSTTDIRIHNMDTLSQQCEVVIKDIVINNQGKIALVSNDEITANSAKPLIRLAPRRFTIGMKEHQMVKLLYRRKPGVKNGEYQGVLAIKCKNKAKDTDSRVNIAAALVHNVPVIVRTSKLPINVKFVSTEIIEDNLEVELKIDGQRSITGTLALINSASGEILTELKNVSIYAQQPVKTLSFPISQYKNRPLLIKFTENSKFGGELVIQKSIK